MADDNRTSGNKFEYTCQAIAVTDFQNEIVLASKSETYNEQPTEENKRSVRFSLNIKINELFREKLGKQFIECKDGSYLNLDKVIRIYFTDSMIVKKVVK